MGTDKLEQTAVNGSGTGSGIDTGLTRGCSGPVRYRLISPDGFPSGTYDTVQEAASAAGGFWPGSGQDETNSGFGWDIEAIR